MEFVLMTTTSTPDTSRSGSVMKFGDYREDEQKIAESAASLVEDEFLQFVSDSDDEDKALLEGFNALSARNRLICYDHCTKIVLDQEQQKGLQLEIGINVSEENPWKQIRKEALLDYLSDEEDAPPEIAEFRLKLNELGDEALVLVGFAAAIADIEDTDTFLFYADPESVKESVSLIRRLEAFERQRVNKTIFKYPRPWQSLGSETEVDLQVEIESKDKVEVEIQRLYASNKVPEPLSFRFAEDIRDGYVELVAKQRNNDVMIRSRVSVAVQSAAQRIESEQQTIPTFPANAWSQYAYELPVDPKQPEENVEDNDETEIGEACEEEEESGEKDFIEPSDAMKELLRVLEFNAIDMYRDDYECITTTAIKQYSKPVIREAFCFIDHKRCSDRFVNAFAWHPTLSGIFVASYTYHTLNNFAQDAKITKEEMNKKLVMLPHPVLLWSFDDTLYPKLVLETPREVTFLSFCPYDSNILIGGSVTGQLVIWDLKNCLHRAEHPDALSDNQKQNREKMYSFMTWSKFVENLQRNKVLPAAISHYELSHKKQITAIKWLNRKHSIASTGLIQESVKPNEVFRHFVTASLDGTVSFWDLDFINSDISPAEIKRADTKRKMSTRAIPEQPISPYEKLNGTFRPIYVTTCEQPISDLIFDDGLFRYEPKDEIKSTQIDERVEFKVIQEHQEKTSNRLLVSSLLGSISSFIWEGFLYKEGKPEKAKQIESFGMIHNGPILMIERNSFMAGVFLSVGEKVFALWSENNQTVPILWRRRETNIQAAQWSSSRISLFFIARRHGIIEVWDLLTRTDDACISYDTGATIITVITQHKLSLPIDVLIIADQKANLRAFTLPSSISQPKDNDENRFKEFIENELKRKERFSEWQHKYLKTNKDLDEPKQLLREESRRTLETPAVVQLQHADKETKTKVEKTRNATGAKAKSVKHVKSKHVYDFSERMRRKWKDMHVKRLMKALLVLKQFDPETIAMHIRPEKDRIAYNEEKKRAIEENFRRVHHQISEIRARLIPPKDVDQEAERLNFITTNVKNMLSSAMDEFQYDAIQMELEAKMNTSRSDMVEIKWHELLERAQKTRSETIKSTFEQRRKAFVGKSAQINNDTDEQRLKFS